MPTKIGVIGLGQMGAGIAANLARKGLLSACFDLHPDAGRSTALAAFRKENAQDVIVGTDICLFAVPSTNNIVELLQGCTVQPGLVVIDLTTSAPDAGRALAARLATQGVGYIDAAMTGGAAGADNGGLTLMIGGADNDVAAAGLVFDAISAQRFHLGPVGAGQTMKLVHNMILHSAFMATCEGLGVARQLGLDLAQAVDVLNAGNARSFVTDTRFPRDILSGTMNGRSVTANLAKDLSLAASLAQTAQCPAPYADLTTHLLDRALDSGMGQRDFTWLFEEFPTLAKDTT